MIFLVVRNKWNMFIITMNTKKIILINPIYKTVSEKKSQRKVSFFRKKNVKHHLQMALIDNKLKQDLSAQILLCVAI